MESIRWRYHPEFQIRILVDGQPAGDAFQLLPAPGAATCLRNYGLLARPVGGGNLVGYVRQYHDGLNWAPAVELTAPCTFAFWLLISPDSTAPALQFYESGGRRFGRTILYANNLSVAGVIDANLVGNTVALTFGATAAEPEKAAAVPPIFSAAVPAGDFTEIQAGRIRAGAAVAFTVTASLAPDQTQAGLDLSLLPRGAYAVRLEGAAPEEERLVADQAVAGGPVRGVIEIYRDSWLTPAQPREYQLSFESV